MSVTGATGDIGFMDKVLLDFRWKLKFHFSEIKTFVLLISGSSIYLQLMQIYGLYIILPLISCGGRTLIEGSNIDPSNLKVSTLDIEIKDAR